MATSATLTETAGAVLARPELRVEIISDEREWGRLAPVWDRVLEAAGEVHPFLEFVWARTWWECFGGGSELHIVVVWEGDEPIAIAPLQITDCRMWGIRLRRLGFLYNSHVPRADFLIARRREECCQAIWEQVSQHCRWDVLQLCQLPDDSPTLEKMASLARAEGHALGTWVSGESPYVELEMGRETYYQTLAAKHRSNLRNRFKRLNQTGPVALETISTADGLSEALEDAFRIEAAAWKGEAGTAIGCAEELRRFYRLFAERAAERGWLQLHFLRAGERRTAFDYSLCYGNRIFLLKLGYDPEFSPYSPSNLLLAQVLDRAFEQGLERYDFLGEFADWKRCWAKDGLRHRWLFIFSKGLKGRAAYSAKFHLAPWMKRLSGRA